MTRTYPENNTVSIYPETEMLARLRRIEDKLDALLAVSEAGEALIRNDRNDADAYRVVLVEP